MKKLMIAAAAALCATVSVQALESANIVGYSDAELRAGFTMTGPCFIDVGDSAVDLTKITVGGEAYVAGENSDIVYINVLADDGSGVGSYSWLDLTGDFDPGWYDYDNDLAPILEGDVVFDPGAGVWVQGDDGYSLKYSGEVLQGTPVTVPLRAGFTAAANSQPGTLDLTDITVGGESYVAGENSDIVYINVLADDGSGVGSYSWLDLTGDFDPGWYDYDNDLAPILEGDVVLPAGQGLWVQGDDGFNLQIPAL